MTVAEPVLAPAFDALAADYDTTFTDTHLGRLVRAPGQKAKVLLHCRRFAEPSYASLLAADYQMFAEVGSDSDLRDWLAVS